MIFFGPCRLLWHLHTFLSGSPTPNLRCGQKRNLPAFQCCTKLAHAADTMLLAVRRLWHLLVSPIFHQICSHFHFTATPSLGLYVLRELFIVTTPLGQACDSNLLSRVGVWQLRFFSQGFVVSLVCLGDLDWRRVSCFCVPKHV